MVSGMAAEEFQNRGREPAAIVQKISGDRNKREHFGFLLLLERQEHLEPRRHP
jgi:hypothetical protein